jgi:RecB family endonuclease NucS
VPGTSAAENFMAKAPSKAIASLNLLPKLQHRIPQHPQLIGSGVRVCIYDAEATPGRQDIMGSNCQLIQVLYINDAT